MSLDWTNGLRPSYLDLFIFFHPTFCACGGAGRVLEPIPAVFGRGRVHHPWTSPQPCSRVTQLWKVSRHTFQNSVRNQSTQHPTSWATAIIIAVIISSVKAHNWKLPPNSWNILIPTVKYVLSDLKLINIYALQKHCCNIDGLRMRDQTASTCSSMSEEPTPSGT